MINNDSTVQRSEKTSNIVHVKTPLGEVGKDKSPPSTACMVAAVLCEVACAAGLRPLGLRAAAGCRCKRR